jgi:sensor domain CHASE-containing protein
MNVWEISQKVSNWYGTIPGGRLTVALAMLIVICLCLIAASKFERLKERRIKQQHTKVLQYSEQRQQRGDVTIWHV